MAFGQQHVARVDEAQLGWLAGPGGERRVQPRVVNAVDVELDFESALEVVAGTVQTLDGQRQHLTRVDHQRRAIRQHQLALHPAGAARPGQRSITRGVGHQQEIVGESKALQLGRAARLEDSVGRAVGAVFEHQGADHADTLRECVGHRVRHQRLATKDAVHIAPGHAHTLDAFVIQTPQHIVVGTHT